MIARHNEAIRQAAESRPDVVRGFVVKLMTVHAGIDP